ncbi:MAG TPA: c-type cytochrome, methanol metabolism-related [Candidatus Acidoferrales bacterium]|nr:c-type cytochrome, methanol metabolism-related [Candidatus Acidoferrales bacterium]
MRDFLARLGMLAFAFGLAASCGADIGNAATMPKTPEASKAVKQVDGKYYDAKGDPTYKIAPDGSVDWHTFSGFRRFNGGCEVCHGPDGSGSSFGPDLTQALKTMDYSEFAGIVAGGKRDVNTAQTLVMPAWGTNKNVMCYLDDIYVYLRARSDGVVGRGRPAKHAPKPAAATKYENSCMGP